MESAQGPTDASNLKSEVKEYASQLGLGNSEQFAYADFNPAIAGEPTDGRPTDETQERIQDTTGSKAGRSNLDDHITGRSWKSGSGPRPGLKSGRSLLNSQESAKWHDIPLAPLQHQEVVKVDEDVSVQLYQEACAISDGEATWFIETLRKKNKADYNWLEEVRQSGTTADKLAAMSLLIQESSIANLKSLDEMMRWATKRSGARSMAGEAIVTLRQIYATNLLPDRKLLYFEQQNLGNLGIGKERKKRLLYYYMEDAVKKRYLEFVKILQEASRDNLQYIKLKAMRAICDLLKEKPEQEALLLSALVDKLGDPDRKTASQAGYLLGQLVETHPAMVLVVVAETENFVFKPHLPRRAMYYAVVFLNQLLLTRSPAQGKDNPAERLIGLYFSLFKLLLESKDARVQADAKQEPDSRKMGKTKQHQHAKGAKRPKQLTARHTSEKETVSAEADAEDARLMSGLLAGVRRALPFVSSGQASALMEGHSTSLYRLIHTAGFSVAVQALSLLFQLLDTKSAISDRFYRALYSMLLSQELAKSVKSAMFLSLLYRALRADISPARTNAFIKRLLQSAGSHLPNFTCGGILLISELIKEKPSMVVPFFQAEENISYGDLSQHGSNPSTQTEPDAPSNSLDARSSKDLDRYDPSKRDPLHCGAEKACAWEIQVLSRHNHPSVAAMAKALLSGVPVEYSGDPIRDFSAANFLDQFIAKKPKRHVDQKQHGHGAAPSLFSKTALDQEGLHQTTDMDFFHRFFDVKAKRMAAGENMKKQKRKRSTQTEAFSSDEEADDSDASSEAIDEFMEGAEEDEAETPAMYANLAEAMDDSEQDTANSGEESDSEAVSEEGTDDINPADLHGPTDEETSSQESDGSVSSYEGSWVMAKSSNVGNAANGRSMDTVSKKRRKTMGADVFAPAEEYSKLIRN